MNFDKKPLTVAEQIQRLKDRGMVITDTDKAGLYLSNISYYRLSAYWYTFLDDPKGEHQFKKNTTFEMALDTYIFDRKYDY